MKRILVSIGLMLVCLAAMGQTKPLLCPIPDCSFANFDEDQLIYPSGESPMMERFFEKFDSVLFFGKGNVNIMHIGGSHVQSGVFTQRFRDNLLNISPDLIGGQYFVFPFTAGKTNNPSHYMVKYTGEWNYCRNAVVREDERTMGLAGAAVWTSDPEASISIITRARSASPITPEFKFNKVTVLGYSDTEDVIPVVGCDGHTINGEYDEDQESFVFHLPLFTDSICIKFDSVPDEFVLTGIFLENGMTGVNVHGIGVNGASLPSYLRCDNFERDLQLIKPDLVIFGIGINDASSDDFDKEMFKKNYESLIDVIRRVKPDCALLFVTNNDSYKRVKRKKYAVNTNGKIVEQAFMDLGKKYDAAVWDQFYIMGGLKSMQSWEKAKLAQKDKVHFTVDGYKLVGDLLYNAFIDKYMEHVKQNAKK